MPQRSAGILLYRVAADAAPEVWLARRGGPFWARKDSGAWTIPKGEHDKGEDPLETARREFAEEMGVPAPDVPLRGRGTFRQPSGKILTVFAAEADFQPEHQLPGTIALPNPVLPCTPWTRRGRRHDHAGDDQRRPRRRR
ncbi:NUDIX domain-containing protein [Cryobacterium algoritolerans]|uniref:NUDIX domain-containing protein n=1 Tax=Cryobacterium algoritolerans TaxID=1259184 RepID=A0A4R8WUQ7_9MICO|nr:NUDIX domain-containing protein [Cryobacterium algoritolerans]TFC17398.1 NUDIX domain-containing protein [Cryobacterium algoritolerans]